MFTIGVIESERSNSTFSNLIIEKKKKEDNESKNRKEEKVVELKKTNQLVQGWYSQVPTFLNSKHFQHNKVSLSLSLLSTKTKPWSHSEWVSEVVSVSLCLSERLSNPNKNSRKCHSSLTLTAPPLLLSQPHTPPNHSSPKNPILSLPFPASSCPFSSFHSSALSSASPALSSPSLLSADPYPCPYSDVADPKTLSVLFTRVWALGSSETIVWAWWNALSYLGSSEFRPGLGPPIAARL